MRLLSRTVRVPSGHRFQLLHHDSATATLKGVFRDRRIRLGLGGQPGSWRRQAGRCPLLALPLGLPIRMLLSGLLLRRPRVSTR